MPTAGYHPGRDPYDPAPRPETPAEERKRTGNPWILSPDEAADFMLRRRITKLSLAGGEVVLEMSPGAFAEDQMRKDAERAAAEKKDIPPPKEPTAEEQEKANAEEWAKAHGLKP